MAYSNRIISEKKEEKERKRKQKESNSSLEGKIKKNGTNETISTLQLVEKNVTIEFPK